MNSGQQSYNLRIEDIWVVVYSFSASMKFHHHVLWFLSLIPCAGAIEHRAEIFWWTKYTYEYLNVSHVVGQRLRAEVSADADVPGWSLSRDCLLQSLGDG